MFPGQDGYELPLCNCWSSVPQSKAKRQGFSGVPFVTVASGLSPTPSATLRAAGSVRRRRQRPVRTGNASGSACASDALVPTAPATPLVPPALAMSPRFRLHHVRRSLWCHPWGFGVQARLPL